MSITIPDSVTSIGEYAFYNCSSLTSISIPSSVTRINWYAFAGCSSLTSFTVPNGVTGIEDSTFRGCTSLANVTIPHSITGIGSYAFYDCIGLENITLPDDIEYIGEHAFGGCTNLIDENGFCVINGKLISYEGSATSIAIPDSVTQICQSAFAGCNGLTSISIPAGVTKIAQGTFLYCTQLTDISISSGNANYSAVNGMILDKAGTTLICYPSAKDMLVIADNVTAIGDYAFSCCSAISGVVIPGNVRSIGRYAFDSSGITTAAMINGVQTIKDHAFSFCNGLTSVSIPSSVTSIGDYAFEYCENLTALSLPETAVHIGEGAFQECVGLVDSNGFLIINNVLHVYAGNATSVSIPYGVTQIATWAFQGKSNLQNIIIPDSVTSIGFGALGYCDLRFISIPASVTYIDQINFNYGNINLAYIDVDPDNPSYCSINGVLFNKEKTELLCYPNKKGNSYVIPDGVVVIQDGAFYGNEDLVSISIPQSVRIIGSEAFSCTNLASIKIPSGVTTIETAAFLGCSQLTNVTLPSSLTTIGEAAFAYCPDLEDVLYDGIREQWDQISVGDNNYPLMAAHLYCYPTVILTLPESLSVIDAEAFIGTPLVDAIRIPGNVTSIAPDAFDPGMTLIVPAGSQWVQWAESYGYYVIEE